VRPVREEPPEEGRIGDPVHDDEELVESELAATAEHPGGAALVEDPSQARGRGRGLALRKQPVAPRAGLEDHVAGRVERAPVAEEERVLETRSRVAGRAAEGLAPHADGVDLVDEDDALAAPLPRELLRL